MVPDLGYTGNMFHPFYRDFLCQSLWCIKMQMVTAEKHYQWRNMDSVNGERSDEKVLGN